MTATRQATKRQRITTVVSLRPDLQQSCTAHRSERGKHQGSALHLILPLSVRCADGADVRAVSVKDSLSILLRAQYLAAAISAGALPRRADQHQLGAHAWFAVQAAEKLTSCPLRSEHV